MQSRALFLLGNIKAGTFANAALAADSHARAHRGGGLTDVFIFHSPESSGRLGADKAWPTHLQQQGLDTEIFNEFTVDLQRDQEALGPLIRHLSRCLNGL